MILGARLYLSSGEERGAFWRIMVFRGEQREDQSSLTEYKRGLQRDD